MSDPADRHLEERLHALAGGVSVPMVPSGDDVRRGRRRLLRMRLALAGATTGTLAIVLGITGLTAGDPTATEPPVVTQPPSTTTPATPDSSPTEEVSDPADPESPDGGSSGDQGAPLGDSGGGSPASTAGDTSDDTEKGRGSSTVGGTQGHPGGHTSTDPTGEPSPDPAADPSGTPTEPSGPSGEPTGTPPTGTPTDPQTPDPTGPPTSPPTSPPTGPPTTGPVRVSQVLDYFNDVLAKHLDADRDHLQDFDAQLDPRTATRVDGELLALGATYRWEDRRGTSDLDVRVATGWDQVGWKCGATPSTWTCHETSDGTAEVAVHDGLREVAAEHADGQVVVVSTDLPARELDEDALAEAAVDQRLVVPGDDVPVAPPTLDAGPFGTAGQLAMVRGGEGFTTTGYTRGPSVRGTWSVAGTDRGTLGWSAQPIYSGGGWECLTLYRSCSEVEVGDDGTTVHVGVLKGRAGWVVQYDGPSYAVRVSSSDPKAPRKRAFPFVVDTAWQPVR